MEDSGCHSFDNTEHDYEHYKKYCSLSLSDKIIYSKVVIDKFYLKTKGKMYVSFSGGKDSTVLLHLVRQKYPNTKAVFFDTGLEYPEIREFVKTFDNVEIVKPDTTFKKIITTKGYPCIGKSFAHILSEYQHGSENALKFFETDSRFGFKRYDWMLKAPFKVSSDCCDILKKKPSHKYSKQTKSYPLIGTRMEESQLRLDKWVKEGDIRSDKNDFLQANPLAIWSETDIKNYIQINNIKLADVYYMPGIKRTGCVFCMFGIMSDKDRFLTLKATHPKLWEYCMKPIDKGGLGMKEVLEFMKIPTGCEQSNLIQFIEDDKK